MRNALLSVQLIHLVWAFLFFGSRTATAQNRVLELDGTNSFVEVPSQIFTNLTESTVEGWVKWKAFTPWSRFFYFGSVEGDLRAFRAVPPMSEIAIQSPGSSGDLRYVIEDRAHFRRQLLVPNLLRTNGWWHIAAVSGSSGMKLFLNGVLVAERDYAGSSSPDGKLWLRNQEMLDWFGAAKTYDASAVQREFTEPNGSVWLQSSNRLVRLDAIERTAREMPWPERALNGRKPTHFFVDDDGYVWIASERGVVLYDGECWSLLDSNDGFPNDWVRAVTSDAKGDMWLITIKGFNAGDQLCRYRRTRSQPKAPSITTVGMRPHKNSSQPMVTAHSTVAFEFEVCDFNGRADMAARGWAW